MSTISAPRRVSKGRRIRKPPPTKVRNARTVYVSLQVSRSFLVYTFIDLLVDPEPLALPHENL